jgi:putative nucleotidyltransferase with HDIG domain
VSTGIARVGRRTPLGLTAVAVRGFDELVADGELAERSGRRAEAREHYELALRRVRNAADGRRACDVLRWIARTHQVDADFEAGLDCVEAARALAEAWGDDSGVGHAINIEAVMRWQQGDLDAAERLYQTARAHAQRAGDGGLTAITTLNLGVIANIRGDFDEARRLYEACLLEYRALGQTKNQCFALNNLGMLHTGQGRLGDAERVLLEAVVLTDASGDLSTRIRIDVNLGDLYLRRGDLPAAERSVRHSLELALATGDRSSMAEATKLLGMIARERDDVAAADTHFSAATEQAVARQDVLLEAEIAREMADLARRQGRNRQVLQHLNRAHRLFTQLRARHDLADVAERTGRLEDEFLEVARKWGESIEAKDRYTQGHCVRVADLACAIAERSGLDGMALFWFRIGALLHDVGKIGIPAEVLNKPGKLDDSEWALMRSHTTVGVEILADVEFPWDVTPLVLSHHERWDGRGYPHGLAGEAIPQIARILCVADVYDALTSTRSYKRAFTHGEAMDIMRKDVGTMFDPVVFAWFEDVSAGSGTATGG